MNEQEEPRHIGVDPYPEWIFELWCEAAGDRMISNGPLQDFEGWSEWRCSLLRAWASVRMWVLGKLWTWR